VTKSHGPVALFRLKFDTGTVVTGARCGAVGWDTALQVGRSRVRQCHWNVSLTQSFHSYYSPGVDSASNRNEYQEYFLGGKRRPVRRADNLTTVICRLSWNLGASTSLKPQGLSSPVIGLLFRVVTMTLGKALTFSCMVGH